MTERASVFCYWGGNMFDGEDGLSYDMNYRRGIKLSRGTTYSQLLDKIYSVMQLNRTQTRVKMTCRYLTLIGQQRINFMPLLVVDDDTVEMMLDVYFQGKGLLIVALYVETEDMYPGYDANHMASIETGPFTRLLTQEYDTPMLESSDMGHRYSTLTRNQNECLDTAYNASLPSNAI
uniref:Uncharacterized protein n=1 Tax=Davidia involucrata TaxID=16924 RepID=A0A5B6ZNA4_DAVIN